MLEGLAGLAVRVLITTGAAVDIADLGRLPGNVAVTDFVPQGAVLQHTDVMVAHGGFGTVLGGLRAGVPMVLTPLFADHFFNAARVTDLGAGIAVPTSFDPRVLPPDFSQAVHTAVLAVLEDPAHRAASRRLAAAMRKHPPVASRVQTLEDISARRFRGP